MLGDREIRQILTERRRGHRFLPVGTKHESSGRFDALFELVIPNNRTAGSPVGLAYTAQPVGSVHGVGVSPSAAGDIDQGRYQNYVDGPTIKSRKRRSTSKPVGGGSVVQRVMQKG